MVFSWQIESKVRSYKWKISIEKCILVGISVPISVDSKGNEVGYRPMDLTDAELRKVLDGIDEAPDDQMRLKRFRKLQEIFQLIQLANDECDFGMGLEFGISLFAHG